MSRAARVVALGAALAAAPARAQPAAQPAGRPAAAGAPTGPNCDPARVMAMSPAEVARGALRAHHPRAVLDSVAPALGRGAYAEAMAAVVQNARAALAAGRVPGPDRVRYARQLARTDSTFAVLVTLPYREQARYNADTVRPARFQLDQAADGSFPLFAGTGDSVVVTAARPADEQRALCWPAIAVDRLLTLYGARRRAETVQRLDALAGRWDAFVANGYSQLPWELALNGRLFAGRGYEPPRRQLVLAHPSLGVEASGTVWRELRRVDAAVVEAVGLIFGYNRDYTRYFGVSAVASFAADRNVAVGGMAHLWFPQAKLGYLRRADPEPRRRGSVLVSVDLYDLLAATPDRLRAARAGALGRALLDATGATR